MNNMVIFCIVVFIVEALGLLAIIINQKKFEKECRGRGAEPAVDMSERIFAYLICIVFPTIVGLLIRK